MIFPSGKEVGRAVELLDEHENSESVGESPVCKAEDIIYVRFHQAHIESIRSTDDKDHTLVLLHFLTEPDTHRFGISKSFSEDITEDHKTIRIFLELCDDVLRIQFSNRLCLT